MYSPEIVCFCDIPVDDLHIHIGKYGRFGLAFLKSFLVERGANPVFYVARNSTVRVVADLSDGERLQEALERLRTLGADGFLNSVPRWEHFDKMMREYHELFKLLGNVIEQQQDSPGVSGDFKRLFDLRWFLDFQVFSFVKFFDDSKSDEDPESFYMEREWRMLGNLKFGLSDVRRVILPESHAARLRKDVPDYVGQVTFVD